MSQMKSMGDTLKGESGKLVGELQTLRDEIKLKLHLASAEGRDAWNRLEPELDDFERRMGNAAEATMGELRNAGSELKTSLERLYHSLKKS
jgi:hypothetical protein